MRISFFWVLRVCSMSIINFKIYFSRVLKGKTGEFMLTMYSISNGMWTLRAVVVFINNKSTTREVQGKRKTHFYCTTGLCIDSKMMLKIRFVYCMHILYIICTFLVLSIMPFKHICIRYYPMAQEINKIHANHVDKPSFE